MFPVPQYLLGHLSDVREFEGRMCRIESDLLCELIGVFPNQILSIKTHFLHRSPSVEVNLTMLNAYVRSYSIYQFSKYSQQHLAHLIAHTRTHDIFDSYCARITLHQAHLAHTLGNESRAEKCYKIAAFLSRKRMIGETRQHV